MSSIIRPMEYRPLGRTGLKVSRLSLGGLLKVFAPTTPHERMVEGRCLEERLIRMQRGGDGYFWIGGPGEEAFNVARIQFGEEVRVTSSTLRSSRCKRRRSSPASIRAAAVSGGVRTSP